MPRYFFTIADHIRDEDTQGSLLSGPEEARTEAIAFAAGLLHDDPALVRDGCDFKVEVTDEKGASVLDVIVRVVAGEAAP